jgi:hypothetical protein
MLDREIIAVNSQTHIKDVRIYVHYELQFMYSVVNLYKEIK